MEFYKQEPVLGTPGTTPTLVYKNSKKNQITVKFGTRYNINTSQMDEVAVSINGPPLKFYKFYLLENNKLIEKDTYNNFATYEEVKKYQSILITDRSDNQTEIIFTHYYLENPYDIQLNYTIKTTDTKVVYSKQILKSPNSPILLYATMNGKKFICFDFGKTDDLIQVHHCNDGKCNTYPIFLLNKSKTLLKKSLFNKTYSLSINIDNQKKILNIMNIEENLSYSQETECEIKRLLQRRGFCYYHAALHALLVPEPMKRLCCQRLLEYMTAMKSTNPILLESFMNIDICENFAAEYGSKPIPDEKLLESTHYFVMKFFYQYLFHFETIQRRIQDSLNNRETLHPVDVLVRHEAHNAGYTGSISLLPDGGFARSIMYILLTDILQYKIAMAYNAVYEEYKEYDIFINVIENNTNTVLPPSLKGRPDYKLYFGLINIRFKKIEENKKPLTSGHAMFGFICKDKKYILDSRLNTPSFYECDWVSIEALYKSYFIQSEFFNENSKDVKTEIVGYYIRDNLPSVDDTCKIIRTAYIQPQTMASILESNLDPRVKDVIQKEMRSVTVKKVLESLPPLSRRHQSPRGSLS